VHFSKFIPLQLPAHSPALDVVHLDWEHDGGAVVRHRH